MFTRLHRLPSFYVVFHAFSLQRSNGLDKSGRPFFFGVLYSFSIKTARAEKRVFDIRSFKRTQACRLHFRDDYRTILVINPMRRWAEKLKFY